MNAAKKALLYDFIQAVKAAIEALEPDQLENSRAPAEIFEAVAGDPKFRDAWTDPEFQAALLAETELISKAWRFVQMLSVRRPTGEVSMESEFRAIAKECGLTEEDLELFHRAGELKFN